MVYLRVACVISLAPNLSNRVICAVIFSVPRQLYPLNIEPPPSLCTTSLRREYRVQQCLLYVPYDGYTSLQHLLTFPSLRPSSLLSSKPNAVGTNVLKAVATALINVVAVTRKLTASLNYDLSGLINWFY
ncbi:hypothetical protein EV361DRAFT_629220 [Lentinula raphanica]|nr:hypothetical protein EV361DRAFT_629220 [Lentinula raphanica]